MAAVGTEEDQAVQAARILVNLRNRRLQRCPAWVYKESAALDGAVFLPPVTWPKGQRSGKRLRGGCWAGSDASSSGEDPERSPALRHLREKSLVASVRHEMTAPRPDSPVYYRAPAGSGSSTSADRKARTRHVVEMAGKASPASVAASPKEPMKAPSPETPLDFCANAAGSGASSSGDDGARPPSKRKAPGPLGSGGGASSGDEGCSSSDKRARVDAEKAISIDMMQGPTTQAADSEKVVKFEFDLNMPCPDEDGCPGFF